MRTFLIVLLVAFCGTGLRAQSALGLWKTIDDETGEAKSHVQLYEQNGQLFGRVAQLLKSSPDRKCDKCPGERRNQEKKMGA